MSGQTRLLESLGFGHENPFDSLNAENEERLPQYFIEPPHYDSVLQTNSPVAIYAPQGGGKTAYRRMIEHASTQKGQLCITYDYFDIPSGTSLKNIDIAFHLQHIVTRVLAGILIYGQAMEPDTFAKKMSVEDRKLLRKMIRHYLGSLHSVQLRTVANSFKSVSDRVREFWGDNFDNVDDIVNVILRVLDKGDTVGTATTSDDSKLPAIPLHQQLDLLLDIARTLEILSVIVLIDKVDETEHTNFPDPKPTFQLIEPLLRSLQTLEKDPLRFKFFLRDELYALQPRPNRIKRYRIEWNDEEIAKQIDARIHAYSGGKVSSLSSIVDMSHSQNIYTLLRAFSQGSPRNAIRFCSHIVDEQLRLDAQVGMLSEKAVMVGLDSYVKQIAEERLLALNIPNSHIDALKRLTADSAAVFSSNAFRTRLRPMREKIIERLVDELESIAIIRRIGSLLPLAVNAPNAVNYALSDPVIGRYFLIKMPIQQFIKNKLRKCEQCGEWIVGDFDLSTPVICRSNHTVL